MLKYNTIIFLDEDGTGLAPYASVAFEGKMHSLGIWDLNVGSKGNVVLFSEPANQKIAELAEKRGLSLADYRSEEMNGSEFSESTLILAFNAEVKQQIYDRFPNAVNVYTIRELLGGSGDLRLPVGGSIDDYEAVCTAADRIADELLESLMGLIRK